MSDKYDIFETHAHLDFFDNGEKDSIFFKLWKSCVENQVTKIVIPPISFESNFVIADLLKGKYQNCIYQAIGLHPKSAINTVLTNNKKEQLLKLYQQNDNVVAVKTGLDFSKTKLQNTQIQHQIDSFRKLVYMAAELKLAVILHIRDAWSEFLDVWDEMVERLHTDNLEVPQTVVHCYNQRNLVQTKNIISKGIQFLGIGGKIFTDLQLREILKEIPLENIVLETDSPYLKPPEYNTPQWISEYAEYNNKKVKEINTPQSLVMIANEIANIKKVTVEQVINTTYNNSVELFRL